MKGAFGSSGSALYRSLYSLMGTVGKSVAPPVGTDRKLQQL